MVCVAVDAGPQHEVPVIGHQQIGEELDVVAFEAFGKNAFEGEVVFVLVEERFAGVPPV